MATTQYRAQSFKAVLVLLATSSAATVTISAGQWIGSTSGDWNVAANWRRCPRQQPIPRYSANVTVNIQSYPGVVHSITISTGGKLVMTGNFNLDISAGGNVYKQSEL